MPQAALAIAGAGNAATMHVLAIDVIDSTTVVVAASRMESTGGEFADDHGCERFADVSEMLERAGADAFSVTTPSGTYLARRVLLPRTASTPSARNHWRSRLDGTSRRRRSQRRPGYDSEELQERFKPVVRTVRDAVEAGRYSDLSTANAHVPWRRDDKYYWGSWKGTRNSDDGGTLMYQSIHGVDVIQPWLGRPRTNFRRTITR